MKFAIIALLFFLSAFPLASAQNATNETTTTSTSTTVPQLTSTPIRIMIIIKGEGVEWLVPKPWSESSLFGNCTFEPYQSDHLNDSYMKLNCNVPWSLASKSNIGDFIYKLLKVSDLDTVATLKADLGKKDALNTYLKIIIFLLVFFIFLYVIYKWYSSRSLSSNRLAPR